MKRVSGKRLAQLLKRRGWVEDGVKGSHHHFKHPDYPGKITVPIHGNRTLTLTVQIGIMKAANITKDEL